MSITKLIRLPEFAVVSQKLKFFLSAALLSLIVACSGGSDTGTSTAQATRYEAVLDAGSGGTRLFLYKVTPGSYPLVVKVMESENSIQPNGAKEDGINNFVCGNQTNYSPPGAVAPQVIVPLLDTLTSTLARLNAPTSQVVVNLLATAGMRTSEITCGQAAVNNLYAIIEQSILVAGYKVGDVRTSDGNSEEGVWTWISLNDYLNNIFQDPARPTVSAAPVGVVEVGGSSAQISYPTNLSANSAQNVYSVSINGKTYSVFNRTYLGMGSTDARKNMRGTTAFPNILSNQCFPVGLTVDGGDSGYANMIPPGAYNFTACTGFYTPYITSTIAATPGGDPMVGNSTGKFVGTGGAYYATDYWNINSAPNLLQSTAISQCASAANFPGIDADENTQTQCSNATYINALIYNSSVGLFKSNPTLFEGTVTLRSGSGSNTNTFISWTKGFLMSKYSL
jgi:hypothetical protein